MRVRWTAMVASLEPRPGPGFWTATVPATAHTWTRTGLFGLSAAVALDGTAVSGSPTMSLVDVIRVPGGMRLDGDVTVSGAKNAALKLMAVALLAPGRSVVENVPRITDIRIMAEVVRRLGCEVTFTDSAFANHTID